MSNIRVFVQLKNSTVFAGETVECQITFTNISQISNPRQKPSPSPELPGTTSGRERWKESLPSQSAPTSLAHFHSTSLSTGKGALPNIGPHRSTLSLNSSAGIKHALGTKLPSGAPRENNLGGQRHKRSVSIVSMGGEVSVASETYMHSQTLGTKRPGRGHTRAASLHVLPRRTGVDPGPSSCGFQ